MRISLSLALVAAVALSNAVFAAEYDRVLVPLPLEETAGAFGSIWVTRVAVSNLASTPVDVQGYGSCPVPCEPPPIPPGGTVYVSSMLRSEVPAAFLFVEHGRRKDLGITIRTFDRSRTHLTWGAAIPVVTREDLFSHTFGIGDIPVTEEFRSTLRIYDFDASTPGSVRVRIYKVTGVGPPTPSEAPPDELLADFVATFTEPVAGGGTSGHPGYAAIPLWLRPELADASRVRVVIDPLEGSGDYWAFVSTTHNSTQHVTVIGP